MKTAAAALDFERAAYLRDRIATVRGAPALLMLKDKGKPKYKWERGKYPKK